MSLLDITDLTITYSTQDETVHAVNGVSFSIDEGVNYGDTLVPATSRRRSVNGRCLTLVTDRINE